jgi:hypothetical protein
MAMRQVAQRSPTGTEARRPSAEGVSKRAAAPRSVDHRPQAAAIDKLVQAMRGSDATVQRMVAVADRDVSKVNDALVLNNLNYAHGHFGGPIGDFDAHRRFDETKPGDRLGIVAHGKPGDINGYDGLAVADILTRPDHPLDKGVASIVLYSCNAGMDMATAPDSSLVQGLSQALAKKGYEIGVEGLKGIGFGFEGIGERTTIGDEATGDRNWFGTRDRLFRKPEYADWGKPRVGFVDATTFLEVAGKFTQREISEMDVMTRAQHISRLMAPFWREVEQEMGPQLYDQLEGWLRVLTYADGGELIQDSR